MRLFRVTWTAAWASGVITPTTGTRDALLEIRQRRRGRRVAGDEDQLDALRGEVAGDLACEAADLVERARAVRQARAVAEVDEVLVRHRHQALVEDGQPAHARVEDADRPRIHLAIVRSVKRDLPSFAVGRRFLLLVAVFFAFQASAAHAFTKTDHRLPMGDGVSLAATLYRPDGAPPQGGWPAVLALHGLGQDRNVMNAVAEAHLAPHGYVVLTVDARGHGASGGQSSLVGPREVADYAAALQWLRLQPGVADARVGALGFSTGRRLGLEALDGARHAPRRCSSRDDVDEPLRRAAPAGPRQVRGSSPTSTTCCRPNAGIPR